MFNSILRNHYYLASREIVMFKDRNNDFEKNHLYKTHDYPPSVLPNNVKVIFMFGNPMNTVVSAHRRINKWGRLHHQHVRSDLFTPNDTILKADTLKLHNLFESWYKPQPFSLINVRYETLYSEKTKAAISDFLGFNLKLFPQKPRSSNWETHPRKKELLEVYGDLNEKIENSDDFKIWKKQ